MSAPDSLYLAYTAEQPPLAAFDIKRRVDRQFFGTEFTFVVIGDSHYIGAPQLGFHELLSCKPIRKGRVATVPLTKSRPAEQPSKREEVYTGCYRFGSVGVTTTITRAPLSAFPGSDYFDIAYRFEPAAYTAINCRSTTVYETYHTYPEYELALYSEHEFTELPATPADEDLTYETPNMNIE